MSNGNGLYSVVLALSKGMESMGAAQNLAEQDAETARVLQSILDQVQRFNGNMQQIELYLQNYIANHSDEKTRKRMSLGSEAAMEKLEQMVDKLKAGDDKIAKEQAAIDQDQGQINDLTDKLNYDQNLLNNNWINGFTLGLNLVIGGHRVAELTDQLTAVSKDQANHEIAKANAQKDQMAALTNTTQPMGTQATNLSTTSSGAMDQMLQIMKDGFLFLSAIDTQAKQL